jgi:hypothetical protein
VKMVAEQRNPAPLYAMQLLQTATGLSSSMAVSTTVFAFIVYLGTPDVDVVPVGDHIGTSPRTVPKLALLLPPIISSWLYLAIFSYMVVRLPPIMLRLGRGAKVGSKAGTVLFILCFGLLLLQNVKTVESIKNCVTILAVQRTS